MKVGKKSMRVPTGKRILSNKGRTKKGRIRAQARNQMRDQEWNFDWTKDNYLYQDAVIYFPRRGMDDNNIYKLLNDSMEGIVFDNDSRVLTRTQKILYDSDNPRVEITYTPVDYIGIFDSPDELQEFESFCETCSRYLNGRCSILNDSKAGKIREEVQHNYCTKYKEKKT